MELDEIIMKLKTASAAFPVSDFQILVIDELEDKKKLLDEMYHLNQLLSVCDLIKDRKVGGNLGNLITTIETYAAICHQRDQGLAEESVQSHMDTYAANCMRKMLRSFQPKQMKEMMRYAQSVEDNG